MLQHLIVEVVCLIYAFFAMYWTVSISRIGQSDVFWISSLFGVTIGTIGYIVPVDKITYAILFNPPIAFLEKILYWFILLIMLLSVVRIASMRPFSKLLITSSLGVVFAIGIALILDFLS